MYDWAPGLHACYVVFIRCLPLCKYACRHWQLRDLVIAAENPDEFYTVYDSAVLCYNTKTDEVCAGGYQLVWVLRGGCANIAQLVKGTPAAPCMHARSMHI